MPRNSQSSNARQDEGESNVTNLPAQRGPNNLTQSQSKNFFEQYGEQASQRSSIVGSLLKFNKGDWLLGQDEEEVPYGTKYVASMDNFLIGWVKWVDGKPAEQNMGRLVDGWQAPKRSELGDNDKDLWELDAQGQARDPWQFSNQVIMKPVGKKYSTDVAVTHVTSSKGGIGALGELCKAFGKEMRTHPNQNPVVELGGDSYKHSNPEFGRIKVPVIKLVGWERGDLFDVAAANAEAEEADQGRSSSKKQSGGGNRSAAGRR